LQLFFINLHFQNLRKMFKKIKYTFLFLVVAVLAVFGYFSSLDSNYEVTRERKIEAPANLIFNHVSDLKNWNKWSPWKEKDSGIQFEFSKTTDNEGAYFRFTDENGQRQKLTNLTIAKDSLIKQMLSGNDETTEMNWQFIPQENGILVRWTTKGELDLMKRIYAKQMDEMMGPTMTRGLELLDKSIHKDMEKHETNIEKITELGSTYYLYKSASTKFENLGKEMDKLLPEVLIYTINHKYEMNGKVFTIYNKWDSANNSVIFSCCVPTKEKITTKDDILTGQTSGGKYLKAKFQGDYKFLRDAWTQANTYIEKNDSIVKDMTRAPFEVYKKGHTISLNPADWVTEIFIPIIEVRQKSNPTLKNGN